MKNIINSYQLYFPQQKKLHWPPHNTHNERDLNGKEIENFHFFLIENLRLVYKKTINMNFSSN